MTHGHGGRRRNAIFAAGAIGALAATAVFVLWIVFNVGGSRVTDGFDDVGELVAALCAAISCSTAARRSQSAQKSWWLLGAACLAWAAGEAAWTYYDLIDGVQVPFPSLADVGFLAAIPLLLAALAVFPGYPKRTIHRVMGLLDGAIIACSVLFASWVMLLGPIYRAHKGSIFAQSIALAYPVGDLVMLSLVIILVSRAKQHHRVSLALVMIGVIALAVSDSSFAYFTEVRNYGTSLLDTGWVAAFLLIALGALYEATHPVTQPVEDPGESTASLVAPYVPVLVVLAVTSIQLIRGVRLAPVSWTMALVLGVLVLGREFAHLLNGPPGEEARYTWSHPFRNHGESLPAKHSCVRDQ